MIASGFVSRRCPDRHALSSLNAMGVSQCPVDQMTAGTSVPWVAVPALGLFGIHADNSGFDIS